MPLRCLLFSSNEEMVQPIWQVLTDLGIEGEYCQNAVDAVEKVTTQLFQIVITDWADQPEAAFLLKTARDQKAAQRPLTLAIVNDDARPQALQAGANSVLVKPLRPEQVRDTLSTACELLRSKLAPAAQPVPAAKTPSEIPAKSAIAAAASASASSAPASVTPVVEKPFRAGEFLQTPNSTPGAQFVTECEVQKSLEEASPEAVDALTELEPMASAVEDSVAAPVAPREALTGWAALQARLTKPVPQPAVEVSTKSELLSYSENPTAAARSPRPNESEEAANLKPQEETEPESALFSYMAGESGENAKPERARPGRDKVLLLCALAVACVVLAAIPRSRQKMQILSHNAVQAGRKWLNPQPVPVTPAITQHENFGQAGDEYKLPVAENIPDATTDPSQIRVVPVLDPTAKPTKSSDTGGAQLPAEGNAAKDQNQGGAEDVAQMPSAEDQSKQPSASSDGDVAATQGAITPAVQASPNPPATPGPVPQETTHVVATPTQIPATPRGTSPATTSAIPSSLKSQTASMTPDAGGAKPVEAAMSSIEPVNLPEPVAWGLLAQPVDPVYPDSARASGQRGSVVLQVLIGRDGTVQDAKFIQGSLVFARAAIDAVKQWRFKPYAMNGRAVSVQSLITLNFKPPA
jgi:periplasmic protein TonB